MTTTEQPQQTRMGVIGGLKVVLGSLQLIVVSLLVYAAALALADPLLGAVFTSSFSAFQAPAFAVVIASAAGSWVGAVALKFVLPNVARRPVSAIAIAVYALGALAAALLIMARGTAEGWEGLLNAVVFIFATRYLLAEDQWDGLPGRRQREG